MRIVLFIFCFASINLNAQGWLQLSDFPGTERDDGSSFVINNKAYCFSGLEVGWQCTGNGFVFDGATETWSAMASLPAGKERQYATGFSYNNKGFVFGGLAPNGSCLKDFWQYSVATNSWTPLPDFPGSARQGMSNFVIKNKAYVVGGRVASNATINEVWEYNFTTTNWTQKNNLPISGMWRGSAFSIDTLGYICYGMNLTSAFNHFIYRYDPVADSWSQIPDLTLPAQNYIGTAVCNKKACLYGGQDSLNTITNILYVFDPADSSLISHAGVPTVGRKGGMTFSLHDVFYITTGLNVNQARIKETWKNSDFVGIKEFYEKIELELYPNPATSVINITGRNAILSSSIVEISNSMGQKVFEQNYNNQIDLSELANGIYFLKIVTSDKRTGITKFIVQK